MANIKPFTGAPDRQLFEKQPDEPDKAWSAFVIYREMGWERTIKKAAVEYKERNGLNGTVETTCRNLEAWASRWGWTARANEWDRELDKHRRRLAYKEVQKMRERHVALGKSLQQLGALELKKFLKDSEAKAKKGILSANDIYRAIEAGVKLERASRGEPDSIVEERHQITDDEERDATRHLLGDEDALKALDHLMQKTSHADTSE